MAVNKNFVIKNGIQVNENLLYGDPDQTRVSIGTYVPLHTLHVIGGIGGTHAHITGISTFDRNLYVGGGLEVVGVTSLSSAGGMTTTGGSVRIGRGLFVADGAQITGVTTINNNINANRNLDVFVQTTTKDLLVTGVGTINGIGSFGSDVDIAGNLTVNGVVLNGGTSIGTDFSTRNLTASGLSTFVGLSTFQNGIFVSGVGTFANDLDINANVDIDLLFKKFNQVSISMVIFGALSMGVVFGYIIAVFSILSTRAQNRSLQSKIKSLTDELNDLRNVAVNETVYEDDEIK